LSKPDFEREERSMKIKTNIKENGLNTNNKKDNTLLCVGFWESIKNQSRRETL